MSYDIDRVEIHREELTQEEISRVEGLDEVLLPSVTTITWQSDGAFVLQNTCAGETQSFYLTRKMLAVINEHAAKPL